MNWALEAESLHVAYGKTPVLWDLSFQIPQGVTVGILGPNGAGKSTLLKAALGVVKPLSGSICVLGESIGTVRNQVAYVPQRESIDWDFPITAWEVVLMGRLGKKGFFQRVHRADREAALAALEQVGMVDYADRQISQLSGGQQQRLFLARSFVQNPKLYFLDEPFAGIDQSTEKLMMGWLQDQKAAGKTIFSVHHDLSTVTAYFDWVILLNTHLVCAGPVASVFHQENLQRAFQKSCLLFEEAASLSAQQMRGWGSS